MLDAEAERGSTVGPEKKKTSRFWALEERVERPPDSQGKEEKAFIEKFPRRPGKR